LWFGGIRAGLTIGVGFLKTEKGIANGTSALKNESKVENVCVFIR
jgi:hypothetical protein